jgi:signal peptidase I
VSSAEEKISPETGFTELPEVAYARADALRHPGGLGALQSLLYIVIVALFIITFCMQPFRIPSESMEPTLLVGDFLLVDRQTLGSVDAGGMLPSASIHRGQIIIFHYPVDPALHLVKRVIGLPGDRVRLRGGHVFIDGQALIEPYAVYRPSAPDSFRDNFPRLQNADPDIDSRWWIRMRHLVDHGELVIPPDSYFVLGDNRNDSEDSRYWGLVPRAAIEGTPLLIYFSLQQDGVDGEVAPMAGPKRHRSSALNAVLNFARWSRTLKLVH